MGNFEAKSYSVLITEEFEKNNNFEFKQEFRSLSGIRKSEEKELTPNQEEISCNSFGNTEQEVIISVISNLARLKNSKVSRYIKNNKESNDNQNEEISMSEFGKIVICETQPIRLNNVRLVIKETKEGFSAEAFCR